MVKNNIKSKLTNYINSKTSRKHTKLEFTLKLGSWNENLYIINNENIQSDSYIFLSLPNGTTKAIYDIFAGTNIVCKEQRNGQLILEALGTVPEQSINIELLIM